MVLSSFADLGHLSNPANRTSYDGVIDRGAQNAWKPSDIHRYNALCLLSEGIGSNHPRSGTTRSGVFFSEKTLLRTTPSSPFKDLRWFSSHNCYDKKAYGKNDSNS